MAKTESPLRRAWAAQLNFRSALGEMRLARTAKGLAGAWFSGQAHHPGELDAPEIVDDPLLVQARAELNAYFAGSETPFEVPLDLAGTPFQIAVWNALRSIALGQHQSYGDIARRIGAPRAVRAVGAAIGRNPISVIVPCHRVLGSSGALTGYAGGLDRKRALLHLEANHA